MQQELNNYAQAKRLQNNSLEAIAQECSRLEEETEFGKGQLTQSVGVHKSKLDAAAQENAAAQKQLEGLRNANRLQLEQNEVVVRKRDGFRGLLTKSQKSRQLEQELSTQLQEELAAAHESTVQLNSELHEFSMVDDRIGSPLSCALDSSMRFSDIKDKPTVPEAPEYQSADLDSPVPKPTDHEKEHELGVRMEEGMPDKYRMVGGDVITPYFFNGTQLTLPALLKTMEVMQVKFRDHTNAWSDGKVQGKLSFDDHLEGLQLLDRIGRNHMRMFISYYGLPYPESNCGRCKAYPGTMGAKPRIRNKTLLTDCPTKMDPCAFCKMVFS